MKMSNCNFLLKMGVALPRPSSWPNKMSERLLNNFLGHKLLDANTILKNTKNLIFCQKWVLPCYAPQEDPTCLENFQKFFFVMSFLMKKEF